MNRILCLLLFASTLQAQVPGWPDGVQDTQFTSSADGSRQPMLFFAPESKAKAPLLIALHSWSGTYTQKAGAPYAAWCIRNGWALAHPDFRGANDHPEAMGSELAVQDVIDATHEAMKRANIDSSRIYLVGVSGGGHMALLMAGRAPWLWAGVSAWVPIHDIEAWHGECKQSGQRYWTMVESALGGPPDNEERRAACLQRSPREWMDRATAPLDINTGIHDGHKGSVPISHALNAFNQLANEGDRIPDALIASMTREAKVPEAQLHATEDPLYKKKVLFRRQSNNARVTIFDGGHEIQHQAAMNWLAAQRQPALALDWEKNMLTIRGAQLPGGVMKVWYIEAYCRPGSTDREWGKTVIKHTTELQDSVEGTVKLRCTLADGVLVDHLITATHDEVDFRITAHNPTDTASEAHWAQPCIRVGPFTATDPPADAYDYLKQSFVFLDGKPAIMPTRDWALKARYIPGQVWAAPGVPRADVNPRPLSSLSPDNGLIGCYSFDQQMIFATAFEPYQELFQGVIRCLHSDFRIGGLKPGETKKIRGKIYLVPNRMDALLKRYGKDFPKQVK